MTNEYGEYLNYKIKNANTNQERRYYEQLKDLNTDELSNDYHRHEAVTTNTAYVPKSQSQNASSNNITNYKDIQPTTVNNDKSLQQDLNGENISSQDDTGLNTDAKSWDGMESGYVENDYNQSTIWDNTIPPKYRAKAIEWSKNQGILEIIPRQQRQKYTYSTVAYISNNQNEPKVQRFPISDVSIVPHQINFDFYDTTEGRIGVSHATEKHMSVEFDVYLTDYIFYGWNLGDNQKNKYYINAPETTRRNFWKSVEDGTYIDRQFLDDIEMSEEFTVFRNSFLQQHLGWVCDFNSHVFGKFTGVINDVSFQINSGESFAKWHIKLEEAVFIDGWYDTSGQKPEVSSTSQDGSTTNSGSAEDIEDISTT